MWRIVPLLVFLSACGSFRLADSIEAQNGQTGQQRELDTLICKDRAHLAVNSPGVFAGDFLLGATLIGYPIAYERDKALERRVFRECMEQRGYSITLNP